MSDTVINEKTINIYNIKLIRPTQLAGYHTQVISIDRNQPYFEIKITNMLYATDSYRFPFLRNGMYIYTRDGELENLFDQLTFFEENNLQSGYKLIEKEIQNLLDKILVRNYKEFLISLEETNND